MSNESTHEYSAIRCTFYLFIFALNELHRDFHRSSIVFSHGVRWPMENGCKAHRSERVDALKIKLFHSNK